MWPGCGLALVEGTDPREGAWDPLVDRELLQRLLPRFDSAELAPGADYWEAIRQYTPTGWPLGDEGFLDSLDAATGRSLSIDVRDGIMAPLRKTAAPSAVSRLRC